MSNTKEVKSIRIYKEDLADLVEVYGSLQKAVDAICVQCRQKKSSEALSKMTSEEQQEVINRIINGMNLADAIQVILLTKKR